jgi:tetratricopeptide (TPR) repeat protein
MRALFLIASFAVLILIATYLLLPGADERVAMLIREGQHAEAIAQLERQLTAGDKRPTTLALLARAYRASGKFDRAIELMEKYITLRPDDPEAFATLGRLYTVQERPEAAMAALARLVALAPTQGNISRLAGLYRIHGRFDDEIALLERMRGRADLSVDDLLRMGEFLSAKGETASATAALVSADAKLPSDQERGRVLLFDLLVSAGRPHEAAERARNWLIAWRKPWIAVRLVRNLARTSPGPDLDRLAEVAVRLHPETTFYLAKAIAEDGAKSSAERLLRGWLSARPAPSVDDLAGFLAAARAIGDSGLLWQSFARALANRSAFEAQAFLAEALADQFGDAAIGPFRSRLSVTALSSRPLFAARLAVQEKSLELAQQFLRKVNLTTLSPAERRLWISLLSASSSDEIAFRYLTGLWLRREIPVEWLPDYVAMAARLGHRNEQMLAMADLARL